MRSLQEWMEYVREQREAAQRGGRRGRAAAPEAEAALPVEDQPAPPDEPDDPPPEVRAAEAVAKAERPTSAATTQTAGAGRRGGRRGPRPGHSPAEFAELLNRIGGAQQAPADDYPGRPGLGRRTREQLMALQGRQRRLPLDIAEEPPPRRIRRAAKETREELIQRLADPQLTLREVALLLNVCPTTVRRYTNRGVLNHFRTPGNQRRFHLSDVLDFIERMRQQQE